jgi:hypothetical protein
MTWSSVRLTGPGPRPSDSFVLDVGFLDQHDGTSTDRGEPNRPASTAAFIADFRGRENNQPFWGRKLRFLGYLAILALGSLIVYLAGNDASGIKSTLSVM